MVYGGTPSESSDRFVIIYPIVSMASVTLRPSILQGFAPKGSLLTFNQLVDVCAATRLIACMSVQLDQVFAALADPTRRAILAMLLEDDMAVTDVAEPFAVSLAAISKHLGVLTKAGLISQEKRGRVKWCKLEPDALREASTWMQAFGQMEAIDLDAFEAFLSQELLT